MSIINNYIPIVGQANIDDLHLLASKLKGKLIQHFNSTSVGGGVAEILNRMMPLLLDLGVNSRWDVIKGGEQFFEVTKKFHNALHGKEANLTKKDFDVFVETNEINAKESQILGDIVFVHDPQPIGLIKRKKSNKWVWRCHVDVSSPDRKVWDFLKSYIQNYDASVFSSAKYAHNLPIKQYLIAPSIDPLSDKNRELEQHEIDAVLKKYKVPQDKPIIAQLSRFDYLKDPIGVVQTYKLVKKYVDCRLILAGGLASDDPEGLEVFEKVKEMVGNDPDVHLLLLPQDDIAINAIQSVSSVIIQKSIREGFGLTVTEALWKGKAVVATNVGGIPLQITNKFSGLLTYSVEGTAFAVKQLLNNPEYAAMLGRNGKEHVRNNFLITRHIKEYLLLFLSLYNKSDIVYL